VDPERHDVDWGDAWTFVAIDAETKLVPSWLVGQRNADDAVIVLDDLCSRLASPVQLSTDAHSMYLTAVPATLRDDVDYGQVVKKYGRKPADPARISTSYVERQNLSMRMCMRRFTRLTKRVQQGRTTQFRVHKSCQTGR
jgi:IS1 family transposase